MVMRIGEKLVDEDVNARTGKYEKRLKVSRRYSLRKMTGIERDFIG